MPVLEEMMQEICVRWFLGSGLKSFSTSVEVEEVGDEMARVSLEGLGDGICTRSSVVFCNAGCVQPGSTQATENGCDIQSETDGMYA